jgi:hypothetical protein
MMYMHVFTGPTPWTDDTLTGMGGGRIPGGPEGRNHGAIEGGGKGAQFQRVGGGLGPVEEVAGTHPPAWRSGRCA